jgi:hypothetical protein
MMMTEIDKENDKWVQFMKMRKNSRDSIVVDMTEHNDIDYGMNLKDYTHDKMVEMIKKMDVSARMAADHIVRLDNINKNLLATLSAAYNKQMLVKVALRDLFEFAEIDQYQRDKESEMDDE